MDGRFVDRTGQRLIAPVLVPVLTKRCSRCKEPKPLDEFYNKKEGKYDKDGACKGCHNVGEKVRRAANPEKEKERVRKWQKANPEKVKERNRKYREAHPEKVKEQKRKWQKANPEKVKEQKRKYYAANPEKEKERVRKYCAANPEKVKEQNRKWQKANSEKVKEQKRKYYAANSEKIRERNRKYREAHPEKVKEQVRKYYAANSEKAKEQKRKSAYNLTPERYSEMLQAQGDCCKVCLVPFGDKTPHIDHDHACCPKRARSCGKCIRGLLCSGCNTMLGTVKDDPDTLRRAAGMLDEWRLPVAAATAVAGKTTLDKTLVIC